MQAMWCGSRGSPDSTTRPVSRRVPSRTRWWCTPATARSAGIGTRSRLAARSETIRMLSPEAIRPLACRARGAPPAPLPAGPLRRLLGAGRPLLDGERGVERVRLVHVVVDLAELLELAV